MFQFEGSNLVNILESYRVGMGGMVREKISQSVGPNT